MSDPLLSIFLPFIKCNNLHRFIQSDDYRLYDDESVLGGGFLLKLYKKITLLSYRYKRLKFIFNSVYVYNQFCADSKRRDVPLLVVHPALNQEIFNASFRRVSDESPKLDICLVARKHPSKGVITFINVLRNIHISYKKQIGKVIFVSHDDLSSINTDGIEIIQPSSDLDIARAYCNADIFISTSWREGFGLPPLEAMSCRCAVICSMSGGVDEYAKDGENCIMFTPRAENELEQCIKTLIDNKSIRDNISTCAEATAKQFTWEKSAYQLMQIISNR